MANGTLAGSVRNIRNMEPISGATVSATPEAGGDEHQTTSADDGTWSMDVAAGVWDLTVTAQGFDPGDYPGIVVIENITTELPFVLHPSDG